MTIRNKVGRPRVFTQKQRYDAARVLRKNGLTRGQKVLEGRGLKMSLTTLISVAKEYGVVFVQGRPAKVA